jgi:hypothetical protein
MRRMNDIDMLFLSARKPAREWSMHRDAIEGNCESRAYLLQTPSVQAESLPRMSNDSARVNRCYHYLILYSPNGPQPVQSNTNDRRNVFDGHKAGLGLESERPTPNKLLCDRQAVGDLEAILLKARQGIGSLAGDATKEPLL